MVQWDRVKRVVADALQRPVEMRAGFLEAACGADAELRHEAEKLLAAEQKLAPLAAPVEGPSGKVGVSAKTISESPRSQHRQNVLVIEGYEIRREISRGGQGIVYQAIQKSTQRKVAVKVLVEGPYASASARRRFEREVELAAHLKHPNIVAVFDSGTAPDGRLFYVMDYVRGVPITQYVRDQKLGLVEALDLLAKMCDAVNHAHQKGVIHRDLKPSNILVDSEGNLHILDFGLAKAITERRETLATMTGQVLGTLPYMSPEQTRGNPDLIDTRTDVYALGVMVYEVLTGEYPYPVTGELAEVLRNISEAQPKPLRRSWTAKSGIAWRSTKLTHSGRCPIDGEVETIVHKSLAKERERRYQSAGELARDIRHYLSSEPLEAKRDSAAYLIRKSLWRHRTAVSVVITLFIVLAGSTVGLSVLWAKAAAAERRTKHERDRANDNASRAEQMAADARTNADIAVRNMQLATENERVAQEQRKQAEVSLGQALLAQADALYVAGRFADASQAYSQAMQHVNRIGASTFNIDLAIGDFHRSCPPAIMIHGVGLGELRGAVVSPRARAVLVGGSKPQLIMLDPASGACFWRLQVSGASKPLAFTRDGHLAAVAIGDGPVVLIDARSGTAIAEFKGHSKRVTCGQFTPAGDRFVSAGLDGVISIWNVATQEEISKIRGGDEPISALRITPSGREVLTVAGPAASRWDLGSGRRVSQNALRDPIRAIDVSEDGKEAIAGLDDGNVAFWDLERNEITPAVLKGNRTDRHVGAVQSVAYVKPSGDIITGGVDQTIRLWRRSLAGLTLVRTYVGHTERIVSLGCVPESSLFVSTSLDGSLRLWDLAADLGYRELNYGLAQIDVVEFLGNSIVASGAADGAICIWDTNTGRMIRRFGRRGPAVVGLARTDDSARIWAATSDGTVNLWDIASGRELRRSEPYSKVVRSIAVSRDGQYVAAGYADGTIALWNANDTNKVIWRIRPHQGFVTGLAFTPDGKRLLSGDWNMSPLDAPATGLPACIRITGIPSGDELGVITGVGGVMTLATSATGVSYLAGGWGGSMFIRNVEQNRPPIPLTGHAYTVWASAFLNERIALTGAEDRTIRFWDTETGQNLRVLGGFDWWIYSTSVSADQGMLAAAIRGRPYFILWDLARPARYRKAQPQAFEAARDLLSRPSNLAPDGNTLLTLGEWYALRGLDAWAKDLLEQARDKGTSVPPLTLAGCYWRLHRFAEAKVEFQRALSEGTASRLYSELCINAVERETIATATPVPKPPTTYPTTRPVRYDFWFDYTGTDEPGRRHWRRVDKTTWEERYPSGKIVRFRIVSIADPSEGGGSVLQRVPDEAFQALVPPLVEGNWFCFRMNNREQWRRLAQIHIAH